MGVLIIVIVFIFVCLFIVINNFLNTIRKLRDDIKELQKEISQDNIVNKHKLQELREEVSYTQELLKKYTQEKLIYKKKKL
jgi:cell division protein FtsB